MKKNSLFVILCLIGCSEFVSAGMLPEEYYDIKNQIKLEFMYGYGEEGAEQRLTYVRPTFSVEKDLFIFYSLADIMRKYPVVNPETTAERDFIRAGFNKLIPPDEYGPPNFEQAASWDDYDKCPEPKRFYLRLVRDWWKDTIKQNYVDFGNSTTNAEAMADAAMKLSNKKTFKNGKKVCNQLFAQNVFDMYFIKGYLNSVSNHNDSGAVNDFYDKYFDLIPAKAFNGCQAFSVIWAMASKDSVRKKRIIGTVLDKMNADENVYMGRKPYDAGCNDGFIRLITGADIVSEPELNKKVLKFLKKHVDMLDERKVYFFEEKPEILYILSAADEIGINAETKALLEKLLASCGDGDRPRPVY